MDDAERSAEIERLRTEWAEVTARRNALAREARELAAELPGIREAFGNPFCYSQPADSAESAARYTAANSHDVVLPTVLALMRADQRLRTIRETLRTLGAGLDEP